MGLFMLCRLARALFDINWKARIRLLGINRDRWVCEFGSHGGLRKDCSIRYHRKMKDSIIYFYLFFYLWGFSDQFYTYFN